MALQRQGKSVSVEEVQRMLQAADVDGDGEVRGGRRPGVWLVLALQLQPSCRIAAVLYRGAPVWLPTSSNNFPASPACPAADQPERVCGRLPGTVHGAPRRLPSHALHAAGHQRRRAAGGGGADPGAGALACCRQGQGGGRLREGRCYRRQVLGSELGSVGRGVQCAPPLPCATCAHPPWQIGYGVSADDARAVLAAHDLDSNGSLDFAEFKAFLTANASSIQASAAACTCWTKPAASCLPAGRQALPSAAERAPAALTPWLQEAVRRRLPGGSDLDELLDVPDSSSMPPQGSMSATGSDPDLT